MAVMDGQEKRMTKKREDFGFEFWFWFLVLNFNFEFWLIKKIDASKVSKDLTSLIVCRSFGNWDKVFQSLQEKTTTILEI